MSVIETERAACYERLDAALNPGQEVIWAESLQTGITRIKDAVEAELQAVAPDVKFKRTTFFNHSFIPDFEMSWVGWHGELATRGLVLRFDCTDELFSKYTLQLGPGSEAPVILSLGEAIDEDPTPEYPLEDIGRALIIPLTAFSILRANPTKAAQTLLCDEHGFVTVDRAREAIAGTSPPEE